MLHVKGGCTGKERAGNEAGRKGPGTGIFTGTAWKIYKTSGLTGNFPGQPGYF